MAVTGQTLMDRVEEGLADLWFLIEGEDADLRDEVEEAMQLFPAPAESPAGRSAVEAAHGLFQRAGIPCPHCAPAA